MICDQAVEQVMITAPAEATSGQRTSFEITIGDSTGRPVDAVIPLRVEIRDPAGRTMEWSGHHAAVHGRWKIHYDFAANDRPGLWTIFARELASGRESRVFIRVK